MNIFEFKAAIDSTGKTTYYTVYNANPRNPTGYDAVGKPHTNPVTKEALLPHVHDKTVPGEVRSPYPDEIPGY